MCTRRPSCDNKESGLLLFYALLLCGVVTGFPNLHLADQMNLLQTTWLDVLCFNLIYRSTPYHGLLIYADDFRISEEDSDQFGMPSQLNVVLRRLCKKMTDLGVTRDEYVLLKALVLLNPGITFVFQCRN